MAPTRKPAAHRAAGRRRPAAPARAVRVAGKNVPIAFNEVLEKRAVPDVEGIAAAARSLVG